MTPMLKAQISQINAALNTLRSAVTDSNQRTATACQERDKFLKEHWTLRREIATLQRLAEDHDNLIAENQRFREHRSQLRASLERVLNRIKTLSNEFRQ